MPSIVTTALQRGPCPSLPELLARYLEEYLAKIDHAVATLSEADLWRRPTEPVNSVANLLLHLSGNLSMWVLRGLGDQEFTRDRAAEFAAREGYSREQLLAQLAEVVAGCATVLRGLDPTELAAPVVIQGYHLDRLGAAVHAVEHMSYHTGQILQLAKLLAPEAGLELYPQHRGERDRLPSA